MRQHSDLNNYKTLNHRIDMEALLEAADPFVNHSIPMITVRIKNNYGQDTIYPVCEKAKTFSKMLGQKTLTRGDINNIKELGYAVDVETEAPAWL